MANPNAQRLWLRIVESKWIWFMCVVATIVVWPSWLYGRIWSNLGWLQLSSMMVTPSSINHAQHSFENSLRFGPAGQRSYLGAGMAFAAVHDGHSAQVMWDQGDIDSALLNTLGDQMQQQEFIETAFVYFRSSSALARDDPQLGTISLMRLCQRFLADMSVLSPTDQASCRSHFGARGDNLLVDGQFDYTLERGWSGVFHFYDEFQATVGRDELAGHPAPSLKYTGMTAGNHFGLFQWLSMRPGETLRYGGYFRADDVQSGGSRLLYLEWRQDGRIEGTYLTTVESDMAWTYLEWEFTLPLGSEPWVQVYPVQLIGDGTIWADDIQLELVPL